MAIQMKAFTASTTSALNSTEQALWVVMKDKLRPVIWQWYDEHKDQKVTKIFGVYTVTIGSFGIAEAIITHIFGARSVGDNANWPQQ